VVIVDYHFPLQSRGDPELSGPTIRSKAMSPYRHLRGSAVLCTLALLPFLAAHAQEQEAAPPRDGRHDFDFEIGVWKTQLSRLQEPLSGSTRWLEYEGTTVVREVWEGRANLAELVATGPAGRIEALSLRLYNPESRQWSLNFANSAGGTLSPPAIGEFRNGRGEFYDQETLNGRAILVRFVISEITATSCRFEQAFSDDGGRTWEVNWIAIDTRVSDAQAQAYRSPSR
jgi:hypothetical protein